MLRRAACAASLFALAGCTDIVPVNDVWDSSIAPADAAQDTVADAGSGRDDRAPWNQIDGPCGPSVRRPRFMPEWPQIMLVVDRSSTMQASFSGSTSKQAAVQSALSDTVRDAQYNILFGLELFPGDANMPGRPGGGSCAHSTCCAGGPSVLTGIGAASDISGRLTCNEQSGCDSNSSDSPSHKALEQVTYLAKPEYNPSYEHSTYVVLITASEPSCSSDPSSDPCSYAKAQARTLGNADIPVAVVSVGNQVDNNPNSCLVQLSKQGTVTPIPGDTRLFMPTSLSSLRDNLSTMFAAIARKSCTLSTYYVIPDNVTPTVTVNNTTIPQDEAQGWSFNSTRSQIKLSGAACDQYLKAPPGQDTFSVEYTCSTCPGQNACI